MNINDLLPSNINLDNVDFSATQRVHDWRNYVGDFSEVWSELTLREKQIIYIFCEDKARNEEWE